METNSWIKRKTSFASLLAFLGMFCGFIALAQNENSTQVYATIGAPALSNSNLALGGGKLYEIRFDPQEFIGDLVARPIGVDGTYAQDEFDADGKEVWRYKVYGFASKVKRY